jgi:hypothetical protein
MSYYKKRRLFYFNNNKIFKKINSFKIFLQKFSFYFFIFQIITVISLYIVYANSDFSKRYKISWILKALNQKFEKYTEINFFDVTKLPSHFKNMTRSAYFNIKGVNVENFEILINHKNVTLLEKQRKLRIKSGMYGYSNTGGEINLRDKFKAEAIHKGKKSKIKLRIKGDDPKHYISPSEFSLRIDLTDNQRIFDMEEFSIHKPLHRNYTYELIFHKLMENVGNLSLKYGIIRLYFNGLDRGLYAYEESPGKEILERNFRRDGPIYSVDEQYGVIYPEVIYKAYSEKKWLNQNENILETGYSILNNIKNQKIEINQDNFNFDKWAKYFALIDLSGTYHGLLTKSVRLYFNPVIGKFEPISFDGHNGLGKENLKEKFIILDLLNEDSIVCESNFFCEENKVWINKFFKNVNKTNKMEFIELYIKYLILYSEHNFINNFLNKYKNEIEKFNNAVYSEFSKKETNYGPGLAYFTFDKSYLYDRANLIREKLKTNLFNSDLRNVIFSINNNKLNIFSSQYTLPFKIESDCFYEENLYVTLVKHENYVLSLKNKCSFVKAVPFLGQSIDVELKKNKSISDSELVNYKDYSKLDEILNGFYNDNIFYPTDQNIIIDENLYVSKNKKIKFKNTQKIFFKENTIIYSEGDIFFEGLDDNPIFLEGNKSNAIIQYGKNFYAKNLIINKFNPPNFKNRIFHGALNLIDSNVNFENVFFKNITSEDAVNLINSLSSFENVNFINISSDAIDVDFGKFNFNKVSCKNIINDCLDISGAIVKGKNLSGTNVKDKVLSVGEKANVVLDVFSSEDSNIGIAAKDESVIHLTNAMIKNNNFAVISFIKKNEWGPAKVYLKNVKFKDNSKNFLLGKTSNIKNNENFINTRTNDEDINSLIYSN